MRLAFVSAGVSIALISLAAPAPAETVRAPHLAPGDSWTYADGNLLKAGTRTTHDTMTLARADKSGIVVEIHPVGTPGPGAERLMGADWSRVRSVNGRQITVNQPLAFPLSPGKAWRVAYVEFNPSDHRHTREAWDMTMKVKGWESVEVSAGSFRALKIEGDGTWTADTAASIVVARGRAPDGRVVTSAQRNVPITVSGRYFKAFWYVPEVHRWVKSEEDYYDSNGVRTGHATSELEAFALADPRETGSSHGTASSQTAQPGEADAPAATARPRHAKRRAAPPPAPAAPHPAPAQPAAPLQETWLTDRAPG